MSNLQSSPWLKGSRGNLPREVVPDCLGKIAQVEINGAVEICYPSIISSVTKSVTIWFPYFEFGYTISTGSERSPTEPLAIEGLAKAENLAIA